MPPPPSKNVAALLNRSLSVNASSDRNFIRSFLVSPLNNLRSVILPLFFFPMKKVGMLALNVSSLTFQMLPPTLTKPSGERSTGGGSLLTANPPFKFRSYSLSISSVLSAVCFASVLHQKLFDMSSTYLEPSMLVSSGWAMHSLRIAISHTTAELFRPYMTVRITYVSKVPCGNNVSDQRNFWTPHQRASSLILQ